MGVFNVIKSKSSSRLDTLSGLPGDIPHGCLAVYVGEERRRYVIKTEYLNHQLFKDLLKKGEEEYGFHYTGGLFIPCDPAFFEQVLWMVGFDHPSDAKSGRMKLMLSVNHNIPEQHGKLRKVRSAIRV